MDRFPITTSGNIAVYTAVFGSYPGPFPPRRVMANADYLCFTDREDVPEPWQAVAVERQFTEPRRDNRYYKHLPHRHLEADCSVYVDANIEINCDLRKRTAEYLAAHDLAFYRHPRRNCIYDEAQVVAATRKDDPVLVAEHIKRLRAVGYPEHNGLVAGSYIWRRHTPGVEQFNERLWACIDAGSKRDQLSINAVLWELGLDYYEIDKPWGPESDEMLYHWPPFDKYERLGAYHWAEFAEDTPYRAHALKVQEWVTEDNVLDVGAGDGLITHLLGAVGVEIDPLAVIMARGRGVDVRQGDIYEVEGRWDAVYCGDVLEHLTEPHRALKRLATVTDTLYLVTPPRNKVLREHHHQEWTPFELLAMMDELGWQLDGGLDLDNDRMYGRFVRGA